LDEWPELTAERIYREIKVKGYTRFQKDSTPLCDGVAEKDLSRVQTIETLPGEQAQVDMGPLWKDR